MHNGLELIREAAARNYPAPLILFTSRGSYEVDLEAMRAGATLYLTKDEANPLLLERAIRYAVEIKQKEHALRQSEARERAKLAEINALLDAVPAIVWVTHDAQAREVFGNWAAHEFLRIPPGGNLSKSAGEGRAPGNFRVFQNGKELAPQELPLQITAATGKPIRNFEEDVVFDNGSQVHLLGNVTPLLGEDGQPRGAVAAFIDITERSLIERSLQEREAQLQLALAEAEEGQRTLAALMENVPEGITIAEAPDATIRMVSRYGQEILGGPHAQKTAQQVADEWKIYDESGTRLLPIQELPLVRAIQRGEVLKNIEVVQVNANGTRLPLSCNAGPIRDTSGKIVGGVVAWRDISERKKAEALLAERNAELRESEERLRAVIENLPEGLVVVNPQGAALHWNRAALEMHGFDRHDAQVDFLHNVLEMFALFTLADQPLPFEQWPVSRLLRGENFHHYEVLVRRRQTDWQRVFSYQGTPIRDNAGEVVMGLLSIHDVTEQKQAEAALRDSERKHRELARDLDVERGKLAAAIDNLPVGVGIGDSQGNTLTLNSAGLKLHGFQSLADMFDRLDKYIKVFELLHLDGTCMPVEEWPVSRALRGEFVQDNELRLRNLLIGHERIVSYSVAPVRGSAGEVILIVYVIQDLTERKRVENALRESESNISQLADALPQLVWTAMPDGSVDYYNRRYLEYNGIAPRDGEKWEWGPVLHPDDLRLTMDAWQHAVTSGEVYQAEHRVQMADGSYRWHLSRAWPVRDGQGQVVRWFGTATDIHEVKQAETILADYAEKLQRSNQELEQFAFVASHDLQEPLRKIRLFANTIQQKMAGKLDAGTQDSFQRMVSASERMQAMIQDLLELSRVSTRGRPFTQVDLSRVAADVVSDLEARIHRTGGQVIIGSLPSIEADSMQIHQALQNIIANALKFHKPGTPPVVRVTSQIIQGNSPNQPLVCISIEDNGIGFDETHFDQMLQPFKRLQGRSQYEGNGMGLAIVKKIIDRHQGEIIARSRPGQGATFILTLPVKQNK